MTDRRPGLGVECRDCLAEGVTTVRRASFPGPRCTTHHRRVVRARAEAAHDKRVTKVYGLAPGQYRLLYDAQGGRCAIWGCRATGKARRLAVDHDHTTGEVRGLLCSIHNRLLGQERDQPEAFDSLAEYLRNPPARRVLSSGEEAA
jgi:hypothetical protein